MDLQSHLALSYYNEIATLNKEHHISIVQHRSSHKIYVKKELSVYNLAVYQHLLHHPISHIPKIYEMVESDGTLTIIEEYISGSTLSEYLAEQGAFPPHEAASLFIQICNIVSSLHHCSPAIIHRDIKPSNLILTESREMYLLDVNAAKYVSANKSEDTVLLGTHGYAAPEQYGFGCSDEHTDIYALGILLQQMLTASPGKKLPPSHPFSEIIKKCTQLQASLRYDCVEDLIKDVEKQMSPASSPIYRPYLPPGFRSGNLYHIFAALPAYPLVFFACYTMKVRGTTPAFAWMERAILAVFLLLIIAFTWNYCDIQRFFPFTKKNNSHLSFIAILVIDFFLFFLAFMILSMLETLFHNLL